MQEPYRTLLIEVMLKTDKRFDFGKNWQLFLKTLTEKQIIDAENALKNLLMTTSLSGKQFLDIGSGSGLSSLAAYRLGADVVSFDYDMFSVDATHYLKNKYAEKQENWKIMQGSALDEVYIHNLGKFDYVYSWGVLHHTGDMCRALKNVAKLVKKNGSLIISIYNTQKTTPLWRIIKKSYVTSPSFIKIVMNYGFSIFFSLCLFITDLLRFKDPFIRYKNYPRGMSFYTDVVDWIGGYPFETATPDEIIDFYEKRDFKLQNMKTVGRKMGCNEFNFKKVL
jgi:2-polyprenyl-3-methyl-5-hydroxy-6-metoxy-1,4-benzoquinol methylase